MADQRRPKSFRPLKRVDPPKGAKPPQPGAVYLQGEDGKGSFVTGVVTDEADGIVDEDFDFEAGKRWAAKQRQQQPPSK